MEWLHKVRTLLAFREDDDAVDERGGNGSMERGARLPSRSARHAVAEVTIHAPRTFSDVTEMADALRARRIAVVSLLGVDSALQQRLLDFIGGVAYAVDGRIHRFAEHLYLLTPAGVQVNAHAARGGRLESAGRTA